MRIELFSKPFKATKKNIENFFKHIENDYDVYGEYKYVVFVYNTRNRMASSFSLKTIRGWRMAKGTDEDCIVFQHRLYDLDYRRITTEEYMEAFEYFELKNKKIKLLPNPRL